jgi:hypothetical protein
VLAPDARPGPLHRGAPSAAPFSVVAVARLCARLLLGKRPYWLPCRALARKCPQGQGGALTLCGRRARPGRCIPESGAISSGSQRGDLAESGGRATWCMPPRLSDPGPPGHALAAVPPAAPLPSGHPTPGTPLYKGIPKGEGRSGSAGDLSGRLARPPPAPPRGERRRTTGPGAAAGPSCGVQTRGPGWRGAGIVARSTARSLGNAARPFETSDPSPSPWPNSRMSGRAARGPIHACPVALALSASTVRLSRGTVSPGPRPAGCTGGCAARNRRSATSQGHLVH